MGSKAAMDLPDIRLCPFCAHDKPIVVTIAGEPSAYVIAYSECGDRAEAITERAGQCRGRCVEPALRSRSLRPSRTPTLTLAESASHTRHLHDRRQRERPGSFVG